MNTNKTKIVTTAIWAVVIIVFLISFTNQVKIDLNAPFVHLKLDGSNNADIGGVKSTKLKAGGSVNATDKTGQGVRVDEAEAGKDINLTTEGAASPKP